MIPVQDRSDDHGNWLQFRIGDARILTAFAPRAQDTTMPLSLGWPGIGSPKYFAQAVTAACAEQSKWITAGFNSGYKEKFDLHIHTISYGKVRTEGIFYLEKMPDNPASVINSNDIDLQMARIELVRTEGVSSNFELVSWMRFSLSHDEAVAIPYGSTGVMVGPGDLGRSELQDAIATFILKTNVHSLSARDVRDILRDVIAKLGPSYSIAA